MPLEPRWPDQLPGSRPGAPGPQNRWGRLLAILPLLLAGCGSAGSSDSAASDFEQGLMLTIDGKEHIVSLKSMDVWLADEAGRPEPFEIRGADVALVGTLPREAHIDYNENWSALIGRSIPLSSRGGDPAWEKPASVTVRGVGQFRIIGGSLTVEKVGSGSEGRTPLSGRIELVVRAAGGETTLHGTFAVTAMTWG